MLSQHRKSLPKPKVLNANEMQKEGERLKSLLSGSESTRAVFNADDTDGLLLYLSSNPTVMSEQSEMMNGQQALNSSDDNDNFEPNRPVNPSLTTESLDLQKLNETMFKEVAIASLKYSLDKDERMFTAKTKQRVTSGALLPLASITSANFGDDLIHSLTKEVTSSALTNDPEGKSKANEQSTLGLEMLLSTYLSRLYTTQNVDTRKPSNNTALDQVMDQLCNPAVQIRDQNKLYLRPQAAAAVASSLKELDSILPDIIFTDSSHRLKNLTLVLLQSLDKLNRLKEWDSIPPLLYQLLGLSKISTCSNSHSHFLLDGVINFLQSLSECPENDAKWAMYTSFTHVGTILRSNPILPKVLLSILKGNTLDDEDNFVVMRGKPLRYMRLTCITLAMGLVLASSIPRMSASVLGAIRDLIVEAETIRLKRKSSAWFNALVSILIAERKDCSMIDGKEKELADEVKRGWDDHANEDAHVISCLKQLVDITQERGTGGGSIAEFSTLNCSLVSLGFSLIDSMKKDTLVIGEGCAGVSILSLHSRCSSQASILLQKAQASTAEIGRQFLVYLFIRVSSNERDDGAMLGTSGLDESLSQLRRSILQSVYGKFCGMAPNAITHSLLLRDLVRSEEWSKSVVDKQAPGIYMLPYLQEIINCLTHIPAGGMPPAVAMVSVIPTIDYLLKATLGLRAYKGSEVDSHIDNIFLIAKKALFCTDVERRRVAVNLLTTLLGFAHQKKHHHSIDDSLIDEIRGYLRRCLTQHQREVRLEVYNALLILLPDPKGDSDIIYEEMSTESEPDLCDVISQMLLKHLERYVTLEEDKESKEARRKRAVSQGTNLSQQVDMSDEEDSCYPPPLRLDLCVITCASNSKTLTLTGGKKKGHRSTALITEALQRMSEPLPFLLSTSKAVTLSSNKMNHRVDLYKLLLKLKEKVVESNLEQYLTWCKDKQIKDDNLTTAILSSCLFVAGISDFFLSMSINKKDKKPELESLVKLFKLRSDAVARAAFLISMPDKKHRNPKKKTKKGTKRRNDEDIEIDKDLEEVKEKYHDDVLIKQHVLDKSKKVIEESLSRMCPAFDAKTLSSYLKLYSVSSNDEEPLLLDLEFRRFLLEKCLSLLNGRALVVRTNERFDSTSSLLSRTRKKKIDLFYIACSLQLGPTLFTEFCCNVLNRDCTSLEQPNESLAQLALEAFIYCVKRMTTTVMGHGISKHQRLLSLLKCSSQAAQSQFQEMKKSCELLISQNNIVKTKLSTVENDLYSWLLPIIEPRGQIVENPNEFCGGLLSELICNGLDDEAATCCDLLSSLLIHMNLENRQILCSKMIRCFDEVDSEGSVKGLIGINHGEPSKNAEVCNKTAAKLVDVSLILDGLLDGTTELFSPDPARQSVWRSILELPTTSIMGDSKDKTKFSHLFGKALCFSGALLAAKGSGSYFDNVHELKDSRLSYIDLVCSSGITKELDMILKSLSNALDAALADAEFVLGKVLPGVRRVNINPLQKMIAGRLHAIIKVVSTLAPCSETMDENGNFMATLLKHTKRLFVLQTRLVNSYSKNSSDFLSCESKQLMSAMSGILNDRTMILLLIMQEKSTLDNGKMIANSKITSHGRIAAQVVFEKERSDNALMKMSSKIKARGDNSGGMWIEEQISVSTVRGFKINTEKKGVTKSQGRNRKKRRKVIESDDDLSAVVSDEADDFSVDINNFSEEDDFDYGSDSSVEQNSTTTI